MLLASADEKPMGDITQKRRLVIPILISSVIQKCEILSSHLLNSTDHEGMQ